MIKFFRHIRQNLIMENRTKRKENVLKTFLVIGPAYRVGVKNLKYD